MARALHPAQVAHDLSRRGIVVLRQRRIQFAQRLDQLVHLRPVTREKFFVLGCGHIGNFLRRHKVYHILANSTLKGNVEVAGPAPKASTLWPVR
jgi:hypothetical protein